MTDLAARLLAAYDHQVRTAIARRLPAGRTMDRDGPLVRVSGGFRGFVGYRSLAGLTGAEVEALIARAVAHFGARGEAFEWKWHAHDEPADLPDRLAAHGFVPEELETVLIGRAERLTDGSPVPGVEIRELTEPADFHRIGRLQSEVWGADWSWLAEDLLARRAVEGDALPVFGALAGAELVSAGWLNLTPGTEFGGLWGGSTLAGWRGRGIYRALVAVRARRAVERGYRYLQVDASPDSEPILRRLGLVAVTTTRPYVRQPDPAD
ncbi:MAG TPA: GNAT family N-acetyltransferase [Jatrophihabitans sp.]|nr:GNAT family N-acetyltransferase [Jatrophihabitans sp.]